MNEKAAPEKSGNKKKLIVFVIAGLLFVSVAGGAAYVFLSGQKASPEKVEEKEELPPAYFEIPAMTVNLNSASRARFLRIRILLELESQEVLPAAKTAMPRIIDGLQTYLRQLSPEDLRGGAGTQKLQTELLDVIGKVDHHMIVKDVLIQEMLIQ
jgi:flagellar FliL protein